MACPSLWPGLGDDARSSPYAFTFTYSPGASEMGFSLPSPGLRAGTFSGAWAATHSIQSGHQEPGVSLAAATQESKSPSGGPSVQYWYFGLPAGLTTPAMWPEPARTKRTGPPKHFAPPNTPRAGAMWSSLVASS